MPTFEDFVAQLQARDPLPPLFPTRPWQPELSREISGATREALFGAAASPEMADACRAGLLLWNDDLDASHTISQGIETPTGSFWHAILHRREGDAANSAYWWRRTGPHPAFATVYTAALEVLKSETAAPAVEFARVLEKAGAWLPLEFIARCEAARRGQTDDAWLRRVQVAEFEALLNWCRAQI